MTPDGVRATAKGKPASPARVEKYLTAKFGEHLAATERVMAEKKLGKKLAEFPKAKGTRNQLTGPGIIGGTKSEPPIESPTLAEIGIDKKRSAQAQKLSDIPEQRLDAILKGLSEQDKTISPAAVLQAERQQVKAEKKHAVAAAVFSAAGPFGTVVIDPPWQVEKIGRDVRPRLAT